MGNQELTYKPRKPTNSARAVEKKKPSTTAAAQLAASAAEASFDAALTPAEQRLRQFDLTTAFGPCTGISRLARWERAHKFGLQPPEDVHTLLLAVDADMHNLWNGRV